MSTSGVRIFRAAVLFALLAATVVYVRHVLLHWSDPTGFFGYYYEEELARDPHFRSPIGQLFWIPLLLDEISTWLLILIGFALILRAADRPAGRALALFIAVFMLVEVEALWQHWTWTSGTPLDLPENFIFLCIYPFIPAAYLWFTTVFPRPLTAEDLTARESGRAPAGRGRFGWRLRFNPLRWASRRLLDPRFIFGSAGTCSAILVAFALAQQAFSGPAEAYKVSALLIILLLGLAAAASILVPLLAFFVGVFYLRASFRVAGPREQKQILWVVQGASVLAWAVLGLLVAKGISSVLKHGGSDSAGLLVEELAVGLGIVGGFSLIVCMAIAVFYEGAFDPRLAIRRTTIYAAVSMLLVGAFVVLESVSSDLLASLMGFPEQSGAWAAGGMVALAFGPLRNRVEVQANRLVDRLLPSSTLAEEGERAHVVVAFSDMVGYTRLTAENQSDALTLVSLFYSTARRAVERQQGRLVKTLGDGVLLEFPTPRQAIKGSLELAEKYAQACQLLELPRLEIRTGIHAGEVVRGRDGDLFGEVVNLASRLESEAAPGEILMSDAVVQALGAASNEEVEAVGERTLKNVPQAVQCYRVVAPTVTGPLPATLSQGAPGVPAVS